MDRSNDMQANVTASAQPRDESLLLRVSGVSRRFRDTKALDGLSLEVPKGAIVGLLGRNGAGKSTLLRIVSGMLRPNAGEVTIDGEKVYDHARALGKLCIIGDTPDFGRLRKISDLFFVCRGLFPLWNDEYARELVGRFDLPMKKKMRTFSRGMQTGLMLCVGLASGAELTVFDEPSLGLDAVLRERFYDLLLEEKRHHPGRTFLVSTHLIDEVARALDYAVMVDAGHMLCSGTVETLQKGYLSVSGEPEAVRELTQGLTVLKEEDTAGSLVRHIKLNTPEDQARIEADTRVRTAPMGLQRLFVFLTEEKEAERHATNA
ncbi:MAG: ABC transporter ATP-binding protein [Eubacteriales bacterium]|nr:ABC transporter ATP-binding protein [Eubacteriales bacterium]